MVLSFNTIDNCTEVSVKGRQVVVSFNHKVIATYQLTDVYDLIFNAVNKVKVEQKDLSGLQRRKLETRIIQQARFLLAL